MPFFGYRQAIFIIFFYLFCDCNALKCRTGEETQPNEDFEYVVRMCLRQMKNATRQENFERSFQSMFDAEKSRKDRNWMQNKNKSYGNRNQGESDGFEYFWSPSSGRDRDKDRDQNERGKMDNDYMDDSDYYHANPLRGMSSDNRAKIRPRPHTYQQQIQHDRDFSYGYGHRDSPYGTRDRNKNSKKTSNREQKGESPLEQLDACMIHCIFQEMQMLDENGKPDKNVVSEKMSQKIRNPELKSFIQDSVEECFEMIDDESNDNRGRGNDAMCDWAKNFAICLEDKGKESCDDWNEPTNRNSNKNQNDQKNKNKNTKGGNNRG